MTSRTNERTSKSRATPDRTARRSDESARSTGESHADETRTDDSTGRRLVIHLQRRVGNRGVARLASAARRNRRNHGTLSRQKSTGGAKTSDRETDSDETKEADEGVEGERVADEPLLVQAKAGAQGRPSLDAPAPLSAGGGRPLSPMTRSFFEERFGRPFGDVRVHTDGRADAASRALDAEAFTHGRDVYFRSGTFDPDSGAGRRLLAHELAHTVQQGRAGGATTQQSAEVAVTTPNDPLEQEAATVATRIARGEDVRDVAFSAATAPVLARQVAESAPAPSPVAGPEPAGDQQAAVPPESIALQGGEQFEPPETIAQQIENEGGRATVPVHFRDVARGEIPIVRRGETYHTPRQRPVGVPLTHPAFASLPEGITPVLAIELREGVVSGFVSVRIGNRVVPSPKGLTRVLRENPTAMGWVGMDRLRLPSPTSSLDGDTLRLGVRNVEFRLAGFLTGAGQFELVNDRVTFDATATMNIPKLEGSQVGVSQDENGVLSVTGDVPIEFGNFAGTLSANYRGGVVDVRGEAGYTAEKMSGTVTLLITDRETARNVASEAIGPDALMQTPEVGDGGAEPTGNGPKPGPRALAGYGTVEVSYTDWLAGTAQVVVDNEGHITVVGAITPPAEVPLFDQRSYIYRFPTVGVRAIYGVPLVGNVFVFADVGLEAIAELGPGKLYDIELLGTYSTDPRVYQNFSIAASLNVSAFAGLRLRAQGGAGVEILAHDIKAGVGVNALAGVRGYVDARPTIGYREQAAPEEGKQGEFFIAGHMELAAQPFLGLSGDLFVELDSPWLSPAPDKRWTWPIGNLVYPLPGQFGIAANVDHVLGSDDVPNVEFGDVNFDSGKFMTDLMSNRALRGRKGEKQAKGTFEDSGSKATPAVGESKASGDGSVAKPPAKTGSETKPSPDRPARGLQRDRTDDVPSASVGKRWLAGMQAVNALAEASKTDPLTGAEIDAALARLRRTYGFTKLSARRVGEDWVVNAAMNPKKKVNVEGEPDAPSGTSGRPGTTRAKKRRRGYSPTSTNKKEDFMKQTGKTKGGMERASKDRKWRKQYGPAVMRNHHLIPQQFKRHRPFVERLNELLGDSKAVKYIDSQIARIPNQEHIRIHKAGYNDEWATIIDRWVRNERGMRELEAKIKEVMRRYNISNSARNWNIQYPSGSRSKVVLKAENWENVKEHLLGKKPDTVEEQLLDKLGYRKSKRGDTVIIKRKRADDSAFQRLTIREGRILLWGRLKK